MQWRVERRSDSISDIHFVPSRIRRYVSWQVFCHWWNMTREQISRKPVTQTAWAKMASLNICTYIYVLVCLEEIRCYHINYIETRAPGFWKPEPFAPTCSWASRSTIFAFNFCKFMSDCSHLKCAAASRSSSGACAAFMMLMYTLFACLNSQWHFLMAALLRVSSFHHNWRLVASSPGTPERCNYVSMSCSFYTNRSMVHELLGMV